MSSENKKYFFVGVRFYCLEKMLELNLNLVEIAVTKDSFAQRELIKRNIKHTVINNKKHLLELIRNTDFDVLVSNGCPYILPISDLRKADEIYINLHPSLLPDLRGFSPVNGSILFERAQGATCHYMDDGIDTGGIISQSKITDNGTKIPLDLLYQLSFMAEVDAFYKAYKQDFKPLEEFKRDETNAIYYSRKMDDQIIRKDESLSDIIRKVKAFQVEGQYARVIKNEKEYQVKDLIKFECEMYNDKNFTDGSIIYMYQKNIVTIKDNEYLLWRLDNTDNLNTGDIFIE